MSRKRNGVVYEDHKLWDLQLRKAGLTNQQILTVLEYDETVDQELLLLGDIAEISGCRNPAVFMERYFQIDDAQLEKEFQKFPPFYSWWLLSLDLSEIYDAPVLLFYKGNLDLLKFPKVAVVGSRSCSSQSKEWFRKSFKFGKRVNCGQWFSQRIDTAAHMAALQNGEERLLWLEQDWMCFILKPINACRSTLAMTIWFSVNMDLASNLWNFIFQLVIASLLAFAVVWSLQRQGCVLVVLLPVSELWKKDAMFCHSRKHLDGLFRWLSPPDPRGAKLVTSGQMCWQSLNLRRNCSLR